MKASGSHMISMADNQQTMAGKLARLRATVALEPHDRVPVVASGGFWPVRYAQMHTMQGAYYSADVAAESYEKAFARWNSWDAFSASLASSGPVLDAVGSRRYNVPGRDLSPHAEFQHPDVTIMSAGEYPELIRDPVKFHAEKLLPRLCTRIGSDDPYVRTKALTKAAIFFARQGARGRTYTARWREEYGIPPLFQGQSLYLPLDWLADHLRGFQEGLLDIKQRPQEVADACEALLPFMITVCMASATSVGDYPLIFNPQHVSPFISPKDYQKVYWPVFKRIVDCLTAKGYKIWCLLEANQEQHLECLQDLPKGKVVAHFEETDLARAKRALGGRLCIAGGMPSRLLTRGTSAEVRERTLSVLKLFENEPGFIMTSTTTIPISAKPENITAWLDAVREYGALGGATKAASEEVLQPAGLPTEKNEPASSEAITRWQAVKAEFGEIRGDESLIEAKWEELERLYLVFLYWLMK